MTTTEVRKASFTELQALTTRLITQAEALAGLEYYTINEDSALGLPV